MGVYFSKKGATSQLRSVYLIIAYFLPATVVYAWLYSSHLLWKGSPIILRMVNFVDNIFLSEVWISEVLRPFFVWCVFLCVYELVQMFNLNTIHSRRSATHKMPASFFLNLYLLCPSPKITSSLAVASQWDNGWPPWWTVGNYVRNGSFYFGFLDVLLRDSSF